MESEIDWDDPLTISLCKALDINERDDLTYEQKYERIKALADEYNRTRKDDGHSSRLH